MDGPARAQRHAAGRDRQAAARGCCGPGKRRRAQLHDEREHRSRGVDLGRVRTLLPQGKGYVGENHPRNRRQGRLNGAMTTTTSMAADAEVTGVEHWTHKGEVRLFLWEKFVGSPEGKPAVLFVHGSSMASQPTFDLTVPGRADSSVMDWFAQRGFVCWCVDMEGYGRSDKRRDIYCDIANGADDLAAATDYIAKTRRIASFCTYGISSGALRAALFAQRHPNRVSRLALDAFVWTGEGSPTLAKRRERLPEYRA